jgi:two-component system response regulator FixJ
VKKTTLDRRAYVVDDDDGIRRLVRRILTGAGIYTREFASAEEFLLAHDWREPGCIILDIQLPHMNGVDLLRRIRAASCTNPITMLSGQGDVMTAVEAVQSGAFDYVRKPFLKDDLLQVVERAFARLNEQLSSPAAKVDDLSVREKEILRAFGGGASNKEVARQLTISTRTVEMHRANLIRKLGVKNLTQALLLINQQRSGAGPQT